MAEHILVTEPSEGVATLTLNRPRKRNALSIALRDEVVEALGRLAHHPGVKAVVITGAGDVFSAGFDLSEFTQAEQDPDFRARLWASSDRFHHACLAFPLPLVAAVNGPAIAGGFDLAVMCDLRVAAEEATFSHPEMTFGDVIYSPLHDLVGGAVARELCFTGRVVTAREALGLRLVSSVVGRAGLAAETARLTGLIARASREVLARTKAKAIRHAGIPLLPTLDL